MDARSLRDQQKRRAWRRGVIAAFVLVLLVSVVSTLWIIPLSDDSDDSGVRPGVATSVPFDPPTPTP